MINDPINTVYEVILGMECIEDMAYLSQKILNMIFLKDHFWIFDDHLQ